MPFIADLSPRCPGGDEREKSEKRGFRIFSLRGDRLPGGRKPFPFLQASSLPEPLLVRLGKKYFTTAFLRKIHWIPSGAGMTSKVKGL